MNTAPNTKLLRFSYLSIILFFVFLPIAVYYFVNSMFFSNKSGNEEVGVFVAEPVSNNFKFSFRADATTLTPLVEKTIYLQAESVSNDSVGVSLITATVKLPTGLELATKTVVNGQGVTTYVLDKTKTKNLVPDTLINLVEYDSVKRELSLIMISDVDSGSKFSFDKGFKDIAQITVKTNFSNPSTYKMGFATGETAVNSMASDTSNGTVNYLNIASLSNSLDLSVGTAITPTPDNISPTAVITAPQNGAVYTPGANVEINIDASDSDGAIAKVVFYHILGVIDGNSQETILFEDTTAPYSFTWNNLQPGTYKIRGKAVDDDGGMQATSNDVVFTVSPTITITPTPVVTPTPTVTPVVDPSYLNINIKLQNKESSARKYAMPNVFIGVYNKDTNVFNYQIVPLSKDGSLVLNNKLATSQYRLAENHEEIPCYIIIKPESYLSKIVPITRSMTPLQTILVTDPFIAGDSIIDTGSFDIVNVRDYVLLKSYYLNDIYDFDTYFFDYNGDNKITIADLGPARNNYGNMGGVALLKNDTTFTSAVIENIITRMRSAMESVMYKVTPL